ncbi:unnamed protein product [Polarella glacialis]|uniref:Uncharacterized protein n=2 Tax=Polarella glacialis TaxID=89957 RepID=A0A813EJQ9_POLGL|nr:unnamed protein product [Polarella glacialis]
MEEDEDKPGADSAEVPAEGVDPETFTAEGEKLDSEAPAEESSASSAEALKLRTDLHESALRVWERARKAQQELVGVGAKSAKPSSHPPLVALRTFVQRFASRDIAKLRDGDASAAEAAILRFVNRGAEVLAVAAASDLQATLATLAMHFNFALLARSGPVPSVQRRCAALLEAVSEMPAAAESFLGKLEDLIAGQRERDRKLKEEQDSKELATVEEKAKGHQQASAPRKGLRERLKLGFARRRQGGARAVASASSRPVRGVLAKRSSSGSQIQKAEKSSEVAELMVFEPPPMPCGAYQLRFRMAERVHGLEDLQAYLLDAAGLQVASMRGAYLLRGEDEGFLDLCTSAAAPASLRSAAPLLFDVRGRPTAALRTSCGIRARTAGFLWLDEVRAAADLRGKNASLDFVGTVLRCLSGPMKRLTLVISPVIPTNDWGQLGSKASVGDRSVWLCEPGAKKRPSAEGVPPSQENSASTSSFSSSSAGSTSKPPRSEPHGHQPGATPSASQGGQPGASAATARPPGTTGGASMTPPPMQEASRQGAAAAAGNSSIPRPPHVGAARHNSTSAAATDRGPFAPSAASQHAGGAPQTGTGRCDSSRHDTNSNTSTATDTKQSSNSASNNTSTNSNSGQQTHNASKHVNNKNKPTATTASNASTSPSNSKNSNVKSSSSKQKITSAAMPPPPLPAMSSRRRALDASARAVSAPKRRKVLVPAPLPIQEPPVVPSTGSRPALTPRARLALAYASAVGAATLRSDAEGFENGKPGTCFWGSQRLPSNEIRQSGVYKAYLRGMAEVADVVGYLTRSGGDPSATTVMSILSPSPTRSLAIDLGLQLNRHAISHFFGKGGTVELVLQALIDEAELFTEACEGSCLAESASGEAEKKQLTSDAWTESYRALPLHMVDGDFEFVRNFLIGQQGR